MRPIRQQQIHHSGVAELGIVLERRLIAVGSPHLDVSPVVDQELSDAQVGVRLVAVIGRAGAEQEGPHALAAIVPRRQARAFVGQMRPPSQQMRDGIDVETWTAWAKASTSAETLRSSDALHLLSTGLVNARTGTSAHAQDDHD